jgi:glutathione peroxidase
VVNTASFCGHTPQYAALQRLHERYQGRGLVVLGVPSNDFNQEAASNQQVREFCDAQFGIEFPMAAISHVKGPEAHPFFRWAAERGGGEPRWNFHKYLVARDGRGVRGFATRVTPDSIELLRAIDSALAAPAA